MADITTGFGTVNLKAQVLDTPSRPGDKLGQHLQGPLNSSPAVVGDSLLPSGSAYGQGIPSVSSEPLHVGQTRPGGVNGQGTGAAGPSPKRTTVLD